MSGRRFAVLAADQAAAVVEVASGAVVAYGLELPAFAFAELLNALNPTPEQVDVLIGERAGRRFLRRIDLRHGAVCSRCGAAMLPGDAAMWHRTTRLVRHRRCPVAGTRRGDEAA